MNIKPLASQLLPSALWASCWEGHLNLSMRNFDQLNQPPALPRGQPLPAPPDRNLSRLSISACRTVNLAKRNPGTSRTFKELHCALERRMPFLPGKQGNEDPHPFLGQTLAWLFLPIFFVLTRRQNNNASKGAAQSVIK